MIEILPQSTGNVVAIRMNGQLVHEDYQQVVPKLEAVIKQYGGLRCYCEMTNFEGFTWQAMMDEIKFDVQHCNQIERCAVVSDASWDNQWMNDFTKMLFHNAQVEFYTTDQAEEAWNWVTQDTEYCGATTGTGQGTVGNTTGTGTDSWSNPTGTGQNTCGHTGNTGQNTCGYTGGTGNTTTGTGNTPSGQTN